MRYRCSILFAFLLSFTTQAAPEQNNQALTAMLLSGEMSQVKAAAQQIYQEESNDPALIDLAAEILLKKYSHASRADIDSVAWLARAIGASQNSRYYDALSEVINNSDNDKLVRHAEKALDDLPDRDGEQYTAGMYTLPANLYAKEDDAVRVDRLKKLMLSGDLRSLKQAAKEIVVTGTKSRALTDIAAEILLTHYKTAQKHQIDTFAWLTNAIGSTGSGRYIDALSEVEAHSDFRKLRRYAEKNREALGSLQEQQYEQGVYNGPLPDYN